MMKKSSSFKGIFFIAILALLSSCGQLNIQKRQYSGGWTIFSGKGVKSEQPVARQHRKPAKPTSVAPQTGTAPVIEVPTVESSTGMSEFKTEVPATLTNTPEIQAVKMNFIQKLALKKAVKNIQPGSDKKIQKRSGGPAHADHSNDTELVLLVILAILLPPVAVLLYEGEVTINFWLTLLFWLLGVLPGIIYALWVILADGGVA